jgi:hypothetical protein
MKKHSTQFENNPLPAAGKEYKQSSQTKQHETQIAPAGEN